MPKILAFIALLLIAPAALSAKAAKGLTGNYQQDGQGGEILELRADGSAVMAGNKTRWSAKGNKLKVGPAVMPYTLRGKQLILTRGKVRTVWNRTDGVGKKALPAPKSGEKSRQPAKAGDGRKPARDKTPAAAGAQDAQAKQALTAGAWCLYTYNKANNSSATRKVKFLPDGMLTISESSETYGSGGTGGQSNSVTTMKWKLKNLRVYADQGGGFRDIGLSAAKNANGGMSLHADGREYSACN